MASKTERSGGRKRDSNATRATLLGAARDLFARHGYDAVTVRDTGEHAGVDASLIARYFGSKAALYRAAVDEDSRNARLISPLANRLAAEGADDPTGRAEVLISCLIGVIALRTSTGFERLSAMRPEESGAILEAAAQTHTEATQPVPGSAAKEA
ncbi:helix-turn-helix domain-containing protein [Streptomyces sp. NPDC050546]|uniref:helix-turn-helix domain-containing protein n=1 Tax=Streptomyces sp. NPDC050546 TaxID=3365628 RepID=UPI0037B79E36